MKPHALVHRGGWLALLLGITGLIFAAAPKNEAAKAQKPTLTDSLGGADRYLTLVSTDKPIYRAGETVYVRAVMLHAHHRRPLPADEQLQAQVEIRGPKGDVLGSGFAACQDSTVGFSWQVPDGAAGGQYTLKVSHPWTGYVPGERKFEVRAYRAPRLKSQIEFLRKAYGPGDEATATLHVERAEGGIPAGARVNVTARVDGQEIFNGQAQVDSNGNCTVRFPLPAEIERGEGTLALVIEDGGVVETAAKTIPILLQTVDLQLYPEGGDLVAGLPTRLYVAAWTPAKKPADIQGVIVDSQGREVARVKTAHEGRGRTSLVPKAGEQYTLKILEPSGIKSTYALPEVKETGGVLTAEDQVTPAGKPVALSIGSTRSGRLRVTLSQREREVAAKDVQVVANKLQRVVLQVPDEADGVLVATLYADDQTPLAERLVFRQPARQINVSITPDKGSHVPGDQVRLTIKTTDGEGKPVAGLVGLTVTDDSVLEMIEKREQAPRLPVMVLLENEVQELADAHVYLDPAQPEKAALAVDLLLGTQGWRRFAAVKLEDFLAQHGDDARRVLAMRVVTKLEASAAAEGRVRAFRAEALQANQLGELPPAPGRPAAAAVPLADEADAKELKDKAADAPADADQLGKALQDGQAKRNAEKEVFSQRRQSAVMARDRRALREMAMIHVRQYAHQVRPDRQPNDRVDFTETLYWAAALRTDEAGEASVEFDLSDSVTSFRVLADAIGEDGAVGSGSGVVEAVEPFYVEPKLPLEVTSGDLIRLPLTAVNALPQPLSNATLELQAPGLVAAPIQPFDLAAGARQRRFMDIEAGALIGTTDLVLRATAGPYSDQVTRKLTVKPAGFPVAIHFGGMLFADEEIRHQFVVPQQVVPGSLTTSVAVYPTPLANMTEALASLIRAPYGCFEQTSSTTYPLVMAQQYFSTHTGVDPKLVQQANEFLGQGYERLRGFECKSGGFEWFGQDPGHEALTAYGLLEFTDMSRVWDVDTAMLARTRSWLLAQRDGSGGFKRQRRALHTWVTDADISNAYILWALLESGQPAADLSREIGALSEAVAQTKNSYVVALAANVAHLADRKAEAQELMDRLVKLQDSDGSLAGATGSIVGSGGEALTIETTALAALAWLRDADYIDFADKAVRFLTTTCKAGRFGSTQSTVLALRAIVEQDKALARPKAPGSLQLVLDGEPVGEPVMFDTDTQGALTLPDVRERLTPGPHTLVVKMRGGSSMPYSVAVNLNTPKPASSDECQVRIETRLADAAVEEGNVTEAQVTVRNLADDVIPTPIAIVGLPGGLEVRHDQLKELVKAGKIAAYEVLGREVVLYWREMKAGDTVEVPLSLVAAIPGSYTGPASRAYLYYTDEHKHWADPLHVEIRQRVQP